MFLFSTLFSPANSVYDPAYRTIYLLKTQAAFVIDKKNDVADFAVVFLEFGVSFWCIEMFLLNKTMESIP